MPYEIEMKFAVADRAALRRQLVRLGAEPLGKQSELDLYFAHPARSFEHTDEALRVRRAGTRVFLTYKGPKLDAFTKSRREIELELASAKDSTVTELLECLGFRRVREVRKQRERFDVPWQKRRVRATLDRVDELGTFLEIELVADERSIDPARSALMAFADRLGLAGSERRSYLELLLEKNAAASDAAARGEDWSET